MNLLVHSTKVFIIRQHSCTKYMPRMQRLFWATPLFVEWREIFVQMWWKNAVGHHEMRDGLMIEVVTLVLASSMTA